VPDIFSCLWAWVSCFERCFFLHWVLPKQKSWLWMLCYFQSFKSVQFREQIFVFLWSANDIVWVDLRKKTVSILGHPKILPFLQALASCLPSFLSVSLKFALWVRMLCSFTKLIKNCEHTHGFCLPKSKQGIFFYFLTAFSFKWFQ